MPVLTTAALVLRRADYGDYDRMVTLLTPGHGRLDAVARGCRRPKSSLTNAAEPFISGEFQLFQKGERYAIETVSGARGFFRIAHGLRALTHGAYWLRLLDAGVPRDVPAEEIFLLALKALAHLNYAPELPAAMLTFAFEAHFMALSGYPPRVDSCVLCGRPIAGEARFDARLGGAVCPSCPSHAPRISLARAAYSTNCRARALKTRQNWSRVRTGPRPRACFANTRSSACKFPKNFCRPLFRRRRRRVYK